jgi:hypothetical protein
MPSQHSPEVKFEIGHVLFVDIVGYSKLLITEQSDELQTLREIVRGTEQFKKAEAEGKLLQPRNNRQVNPHNLFAETNRNIFTLSELVRLTLLPFYSTINV